MTGSSATSVFFLTSLLPYLWLAIAVLCVICEGAWHSRVPLCLIPGSLAALIFSFFARTASLQALLFFAVSAVVLLLRFTVFRRRRSVLPPPGSRVLAVYTVSVYGMGKVRWNGALYDAVLAEGTVVEPGDMARVVSTAGNAVSIRPDTSTH